jgi:hypothetical protein
MPDADKMTVPVPVPEETEVRQLTLLRLEWNLPIVVRAGTDSAK